MTTAASPASVVTSSSLPRWYSHRFNRVAVYRAAAAVASTLPRWARLRLAAELGSLAALPTHAVVAPEADAAVERFLRGAPGAVNFVTRREPRSVLPLMGALRRGEMVAMQGDRGLGNRGDVAMPFFGAPAPFPLGPFVLARAAGVPVVPSFCVFEPDRRYTIVVGEPITVKEGAEVEALGAWVTALEAAVRA